MVLLDIILFKISTFIFSFRVIFFLCVWVNGVSVTIIWRFDSVVGGGFSVFSVSVTVDIFLIFNGQKINLALLSSQLGQRVFGLS